MDLSSFQQAKAQLGNISRTREEDAKEKSQKAIDKYNEQVKNPLEMISGSAVEDTGLDIVKAGVKSLGKDAINKLGITKDTIKTFTDKLDKIDKKELLKNPKKALEDAFKGEDSEGIKALVKRTIQEKLKNVEIKGVGKVKDLLPKINKDIKAPVKKLANVNLKGKAENLAKANSDTSSLDDDILKAIPANPNANDIRSAQLRQSMRDLRTKPNTLTLDDDLTNAQRGGQKVKVSLDDEPKAPKISKPIAPEVDADADADAAKAGLKKAGEKAGSTFLEVDDSLGGEGDIGGDIIAGIASLGAFIYGIKHKPKIAPMHTVGRVAPSLQLGLDTA